MILHSGESAGIKTGSDFAVGLYILVRTILQGVSSVCYVFMMIRKLRQTGRIRSVWGRARRLLYFTYFVFETEPHCVA